jgi:Phytanoyl-CoA dioxygenase (PhyH)
MTSEIGSPLQIFDHAMKTRGWMKFDSVVPTALCDRMRVDIAGHVQRCGELQRQAGIPGAPDGTAHHTVGYGDSLDEFLERGFLDEYITRFFDGPYILHAFNPVTVSSGHRNYVHRIHKDVRTHMGGFRVLVNLLLMVDEFTLENGATFILSGSHHEPTPPPQDFFFAHAERIVGPQGSVVLFDSNAWHCAGENRSDRTRSALTMSLSRPFLKPQMDYARFLGPERGARLSDRMRQLLGFNAGVATSLEEWYRPAGSRMYRHDQG